MGTISFGIKWYVFREQQKQEKIIQKLNCYYENSWYGSRKTNRKKRKPLTRLIFGCSRKERGPVKNEAD